jgi:hypothetical protein
MKPHLHRQIREVLQSGQPLSETERRAVEEHLEACSECRTYAQTLEQLGHALPGVIPTRYLTADQIRQKGEELQTRWLPRQKKAAAMRSWQSLAWAGLVLTGVLGIIVIASSLRPAMPVSPPQPPATETLAQATEARLTPTLAPTTNPVPARLAAMALAPGVCNQTVNPEPPEYGLPERPAGLLGGGSVLNGDFAFDLWLVCDPSFNSGAWDLAHDSLIDKLGFYLAWAYQGSSEEEIQSAWGIQPYVKWTAGMSGGAGSSFTEASGIYFPPDAFLDIAGPEEAIIEFVFKARSGRDAALGQALTFTLVRKADGYVPTGISTRTLSAEELLAWESQPTPTPPFPTLPADQIPTTLAELKARLEAWRDSLLDEPGWIHQQQRILLGGGTLPNGRSIPDPYVMDEWYLVEADGRVRAAVNRMLDEAGEVYQVTVYRDGAWSNLTFGGEVVPDELSYDPTLGVLPQAAGADRLESGEMYFEGALVGDQYIITNGDTRLEVLLEPGSGKVLSLMTYLIQPGALQFRSSDLIQVQERVEQPPEEILALLEQAPAAYQPDEPQGTPIPPDYAPSRHNLSVTLIPGDDFMQPSFWFGDLYAENYLLGRVDFGAVPGGYCDRSADGGKLAYTYSIQNDAGEYIGRLHWLDLGDIQTVHNDLPNIRLLSTVSWSPVDERLAFSGCDEQSGTCGLTVYNTATGELVISDEMIGTGMPVLWKPEGDQVAFLASQPDESLRLYVIEAATGATLYTATYDWEANRADGDAGFNEWGVAFPQSGDSFSGCASPQ